MTVALRRYHPEPSLLKRIPQRTMQMAMTSVGATPANVRVVESLLILLTWGVPNTDSIQEFPFVLAGSLIHLAMHLGLHKPLRSQDFSRRKLYLTEEDLIRRSELWTYTVILYQRCALFSFPSHPTPSFEVASSHFRRFCIINGNFFYPTQDVSRCRQEGNHLWTSLPAELRYSSKLSGMTANNLVTLVDQGQASDDGEDNGLIRSLIKLADAQLSEHRPVDFQKGNASMFIALLAVFCSNIISITRSSLDY